MGTTEVREGKTQTQVFAAVVEFEYVRDEYPRQRDIVDDTPVTKGAVSNHVSELVDLGLLAETEEGGYEVVEDGLRDEYREHVETVLTRERGLEPFEDRVDAHNEVRTWTKRNLDSVLGAEVVLAALVEAFVESRGTRRIQTFREAFLRTDEVLRATAVNAVGSSRFDGQEEGEDDEITALLSLAVSFNHAHEQVAGVGERVPAVDEYLPGDVPEQRMIEYLQNKEN
jgi:DNA-binding transcriptional ArsR family regulator